MIVLAGGLTLRAPDVVPDVARAPIEQLRECARLELDAPPGLQEVIERAAFGRWGAGRLRRRDRAARLSAYRQLLVGWGELGTDPRPDRRRTG